MPSFRKNNSFKKTSIGDDLSHDSAEHKHNALSKPSAGPKIHNKLDITAGTCVHTGFYYELDAARQSQWTEFWRKCEHTHPRQHLLFGDVERVRGRTPVYAIGEVDDRIVCVGIFTIRPLLFGKRFSIEAECLGGPVFDDLDCATEFLSQVKSYFQALNVGSIRLSPYWLYPEAEQVESLLNELGFSTLPSVGQAGARFSTGLIDLSLSSDEIFAGLKSKIRQEVRRADRLGVSIRATDKVDEANQFFRYLRKMHRQRSLDSAAMSPREFKATFEHILREEDVGVLLVAFSDQTFLGGFLIVKGKQTCHYSHYVVVRRPLRKAANLTIAPALWWQGIQWAKKQGCRWIDVEGYKKDLEPYDRRYQYYKSKSRFNPIPAQRLGVHTYVHSPTMYAVRKGCKFCMHKLYVARGLQYQLKNRWISFKAKHLRHSKHE